VLASLGEDDRRTSFGGQSDRVPGDQLGPLLVCGERTVDLLNAGFGWKHARVGL
jgi:hypothetical protein